MVELTSDSQLELMASMRISIIEVMWHHMIMMLQLINKAVQLQNISL